MIPESNEDGMLALLVPDLPCADALLPWLRRIDASRHYSNFGPLVRELEQVLSRDWPGEAARAGQAPLHVVTTSSGTAALELALAALGLPRGSEVLLPAFTFAATASAVLRQGLVPVFADVQPDHWMLGPQLARAALASRPIRLVLPVATFGLALDVQGWDRFVEETGIPVLMDAAAAFGNQRIGKHAHVAFSLHATKPFGVGEGGLLVSRDEALASRVRRLSNFGIVAGQAGQIAGNAKMSEYAAAVALCQWARFGHRWAQRSRAWASYRAQLLRVPGVKLQASGDVAALPANLVVDLPLRADRALPALARAGIECRRWYYPPLSAQPAFSDCPIFQEADAGDAGLPCTQRLATHGLGLPWHSFMDGAGMERVRRVLTQVLEMPQGAARSAVDADQDTLSATCGQGALQ